jgi:hypothetical protein
MAKKRNLFLRSRKLVTLGSLRLGLELSGEENCIGFHLILSDCKVQIRRNWLLRSHRCEGNFFILDELKKSFKFAKKLR